MNSDDLRYGLRLYLSDQRDWSVDTFGPGRRTIGICEHIKKELAEMLEAKQRVNFERAWPAVKPEDEPMEHVK